ncbi:hypothetical protein F4604DRAFT_1784639 [Suillus subluteus]|nr:hypothetical protein F4604DRAFT_1784639 [Suillus subluteus]
MGSSSDTLSPPTPPTQTSTPDISQMLIPPASDPILRFLPSSLLNHGSVQGQSASLPVPSIIFMLLFALLLPICHALITASPAIKCVSQKHSGKNAVRPAALAENSA